MIGQTIQEAISETIENRDTAFGLIKELTVGLQELVEIVDESHDILDVLTAEEDKTQFVSDEIMQKIQAKFDAKNEWFDEMVAKKESFGENCVQGIVRRTLRKLARIMRC